MHMLRTFVILSVVSMAVSHPFVFDAVATVGGPTTIMSLAYDAQNHDVLYVEQSGSGRGCPPIVRKVDLSTVKDLAIESCDELEERFKNTTGDYEEDYRAYEQEIASRFAGLQALPPIQFQDQHIGVKIEKIAERTVESTSELMWTEYRTYVFQHESLLTSQLYFRGCKENEQHTISGYAVPDTDALVLVIASTGDCFEGGYPLERLFVVRGYEAQDATNNTPNSLVVQATGYSTTTQLARQIPSFFKTLYVEEDVKAGMEQSTNLVQMPESAFATTTYTQEVPSATTSLVQQLPVRSNYPPLILVFVVGFISGLVIARVQKVFNKEFLSKTEEYSARTPLRPNSEKIDGTSS